MKNITSKLTVFFAAILAILGQAHAQANVPTYGQRWQPWCYDRLGYGPSTIGTEGCLLTDIASIRTFYGNWQTPRTMNQWLKSHGGFYYDSVVWGAVPGYRGQRDYSRVTADLNFINSCLDQGYLVVVQTYMPPYRTQPHWVLLTGHWGYRYSMMDPWWGDKAYFNDRYGDPGRWIYRAAWFGRW